MMMNLARDYETADISVHQPAKSFQIITMEPSQLADAVTIADYLRDGKCIALNTETISPDLEARMLDFLRGFSYVRNCAVVRASSELIFLAPYSIVLEYDADDELREE